MLEKRIYTRQELIELYKTKRLDAIKNKIKREGYSFNDCGRGASYTMEIISLPNTDNQFKRYCIEQLGFKPQVNFTILKYYIKNVLHNEGFITLQFNEMAAVMREQMQDILEKENITITEQTISAYFQQLKSIGWLYSDCFEHVYYVYDNNICKNKYITKEEYCEMYKQYYEIIDREHDYGKAETFIKRKYGSKPKKRIKELLNAFYNKEYKAAAALLEKEI